MAAEKSNKSGQEKRKRRGPVYTVLASLPATPGEPRTWVQAKSCGTTLRDCETDVAMMAEVDRVGSRYMVCRVLAVHEIRERPVARALTMLTPAAAVDNEGMPPA